MNQYPFLSFVVPARNEENFIAECIESLMAQDYPKDKMEILVVNGASEDKTENIALEYSQKYSFVKVLQNPKKFTPISMNVGIKAA
ncbi:MAG: glycosyltransferase, partial [bacterium]|nr:glycosyltransferase [bacterium]